MHTLAVEASDFMAVVDYGCAADGLSGAGGDAAAIELANTFVPKELAALGGPAAD